MPIELKHELVLLCEGLADQKFFRALMTVRKDFPPFDMLEPNNELSGAGGFQKMLVAIRGDRKGFSRIKGVLVVVDSASDPAQTFAAVRAQIAAAGYPVPSAPLELAPAANGHPAIMVMLLPSEREQGGLETLCVRELSSRIPWVTECVDQFLKCGESTAHGWSPEKKDKARYHCMIAATNEDDPSRAVSYAFKTPPVINVAADCFDAVEQRLRVFCAAVAP